MNFRPSAGVLVLLGLAGAPVDIDMDLPSLGAGASGANFVNAK